MKKKYLFFLAGFIFVFFGFGFKNVKADSFSPSVSTSSLIASYNFESDGTDTLGNYNLTNNGSVVFDSGKIGNSADFGNPNTSKSLTGTNLGINGGTISVSAWFQIQAQPATNFFETIFYQGNNTSETAYWLNYRDDAGTKKISAGRGRYAIDWNLLDYNITLTTGVWHHIVYTFNGSTGEQNLYVDGTNRGNNTASTGNGSNAYGDGSSVGREVNGTNHYFSGQIDLVDVFTRVLNSTEASDLYNSGNGNFYGVHGPPVLSPVLTSTTPSSFYTNTSTTLTVSGDNFTSSTKAHIIFQYNPFTGTTTQSGSISSNSFTTTTASFSIPNNLLTMSGYAHIYLTDTGTGLNSTSSLDFPIYDSTINSSSSNFMSTATDTIVGQAFQFLIYLFELGIIFLVAYVGIKLFRK